MAGSSPGASCHPTASCGFLTGGCYTTVSGFLRLEPFASRPTVGGLPSVVRLRRRLARSQLTYRTVDHSDAHTSASFTQCDLISFRHANALATFRAVRDTTTVR